MSHETLQLLTGTDEQFAQAVVDLGWFRYPPRLTGYDFRGRARPSLTPQFRRAGQVPDTGAWVYRLTLDSHRWQDAVAIAESQLRAEPQFAVVFVTLPRTLLILAPEDPDKAFRNTPGIRMAQLFLDTARPGNYENEMLRRLKTAKAQGFRAKLQEVVNVERVTKKFYDEFKEHKDAFIDFIEGIEKLENRQWYASVVLNRLMFIYFIQANGLLDGDPQYLRTKLATNAGNTSGYYRDFLCPLFFDGFAVPADERPERIRQLIGDVPYLNGGLFMPHKLEQDNAGIDIKDAAFGRLYEFFDRYTWHIDDRPLTTERQINPDVLGFIFEKYVNQKQMGAYYTKEDITGYICRNTVIPRLFDMLSEARGNACPLPISKIEPYVYPAVKHGADLPLPAEIDAGVADVLLRARWNESAPPEYALPTETWRELVARRQRCAAIQTDFRDGKITTANDFITYNLDLPRMARDFVDTCQDAAVLRDFYFRCLQQITILDPTCGSGAFLFAALNILYPLYEACLDRMEILAATGAGDNSLALTMKGEFAFANDVDAQQSFLDPATLTDDVLQSFRAELARIADHANRSYYIHKTIIVNNLYGVDIMEEAVEICKLRLFLNLIAHADPDPTKPNQGIEPLPDIDFSIIAGNTLVGYVNRENRSRLWADAGFDFEPVPNLDILILAYSDKLEEFRKHQLGLPTAHCDSKDEVQRAAEIVRRPLNQDTCKLYKSAGLVSDRTTRQQFEETHNPVHWFVEFPQVMAHGGFDVLIGNPPYVELKDVTGYRLFGFKTAACADLYACVMERAVAIVQHHGRIGLIVPMSCFSVEKFAPLQALYLTKTEPIHVSNWSGDAHPSKLFEGVDKRLSIVLSQRNNPSGPSPFVTRYMKWYADERANLFAVRPAYQQVNSLKQSLFFQSSLVKLGSPIEATILHKLRQTKQTVGLLSSPSGTNTLYYTRKVSFFLQFLDFIPTVVDGLGQRREPSELKTLTFKTPQLRNLCLAALSSSLFYWFNTINSDCRNLNKREITAFPVPAGQASQDQTLIDSLCSDLMRSYQEHSQMRTVIYAGKGAITVQYFNFRPSKPIIDRIDEALALHYGLSGEELEFIINYDVKYRTGREPEVAETAEP